MNVRDLVASPFTPRIKDYDMPDGLKVPTDLKTYDCIDRLTIFMGTMDIHKLSKPAWCRFFHITLCGATRRFQKTQAKKLEIQQRLNESFFKDLIARPPASMEDFFTQAHNFIRANEANTEIIFETPSGVIVTIDTTWATRIHRGDRKKVGLNKTVQFVRTDNGTEFVNKDLTDYYKSVGITHEKTVPRTIQQNGVVELQNRTLVEAARTMLIFSKAPLFLWTEAVATACYTQNRSLIHTLQLQRTVYIMK
ncbi:retrovirus-related pol polyprotein from transposon TNT 1-94 [Tanacetum coccineum]